MLLPTVQPVDNNIIIYVYIIIQQVGNFQDFYPDNLRYNLHVCMYVVNLTWSSYRVQNFAIAHPDENPKSCLPKPKPNVNH